MKSIRGPFQVGSRLPVASGVRMLSDLLPGRGCPGALRSVFCHPFPPQASHLRPSHIRGRLQSHSSTLQLETRMFCKVSI